MSFLALRGLARRVAPAWLARVAPAWLARVAPAWLARVAPATGPASADQ